MAKSSFSSSSLLLLLILLLWCWWGDGLEEAKREGKDAVPTGTELWCVAKNNAEDSALQPALDWACGPGGADCRPIQQGGACFEPQDIQSYASYAFNDYYIRNGISASACDFSGTAALTSLNPSHGSCIFPSRLFIIKKWKLQWIGNIDHGAGGGGHERRVPTAAEDMELVLDSCFCGDVGFGYH
ncbi:hypothetical protein Cni_G17008 [Canna indica]|uniref:X8 domain-containing protein n=1 Tax=Canna indica TaxID=4628 RepID=A0AAQ3QD49_9LILI|nr:hypothetical protein Cni_G17008 [Canna indica]